MKNPLKRKKVEVIEEVKAEEVQAPESNVTFHKERWDNDSGTNQLVADELPSVNE